MTNILFGAWVLVVRIIVIIVSMVTIPIWAPLVYLHDLGKEFRK